MRVAPTNLLQATNREPAPVERRGRSTAKHRGPDRRRKAKLNIGLEVSPTGISLAIVSTDTADQSQSLILDTVPFDWESKLSRNDWCIDELTQVLGKLVDKHRLSGQSISVAISGPSCVTRAFFGDNDEVDLNCREVTERANHYLALGRGEKIFCHAERSVDAKRKRAWVTVAKRPVVETIASAVENTGMRLVRIEHTLTALCQAIGHAGHDSEEPVLLVSTSSGRADLFLTFRGQLILDYRPTSNGDGNYCSIDLWSNAVCKHVKCLRRFVGSQLPFGKNELRKICLPGANWEAGAEVRQLLQEHSLTVCSIPTKAVCGDLLVESAMLESTEMMAAIWMARSVEMNEAAISGDLAKSLKQERNVSWKQIVGTLWPLAACLLLIAGIYAADLHHQRLERLAEADFEELQSTRIEYQRLVHVLEEQRVAAESFESLQSELTPVQWSNIVKLAGRALPKGTWLERVAVDADSNISITGASFSEDAIYEYVNTLNATGLFEYVTLRATRQIQLSSGPVSEFDLSALVNGIIDTTVANRTDVSPDNVRL